MTLGYLLCQWSALKMERVIEVACGHRVSRTDNLSAFNGDKVGYMTVGEAIQKYGDCRVLYVEWQKEDAILFLVENSD